MNNGLGIVSCRCGSSAFLFMDVAHTDCILVATKDCLHCQLIWWLLSNLFLLISCLVCKMSKNCENWPKAWAHFKPQYHFNGFCFSYKDIYGIDDQLYFNWLFIFISIYLHIFCFILFSSAKPLNKKKSLYFHIWHRKLFTPEMV